MYNSIKYFKEECINKFEKLEDNFMKNPEKFAEYVTGLTAELHKLGLKMIKDSLEAMNEMIRKSASRKDKWWIESNDEKELITSLGNVSFRKTLFTNKETGKSEYLLDRIDTLPLYQILHTDTEDLVLTHAGLDVDHLVYENDKITVIKSIDEAYKADPFKCMVSIDIHYMAAAKLRQLDHKLIIGHYPCQHQNEDGGYEIFRGINYTCIDSGAGHDGKLAIYCWESKEVHYI